MLSRARAQTASRERLLLFLSEYDSDMLRGNTELTRLSSTKFQADMSPPGLQSVGWAGVFPGAILPCTDTEQQLLHTNVCAAALSFDANSQIAGSNRLKLDVSALDTGIVNRGTRDDDASGTLEWVLGNDPTEVVSSATFGRP